VTDPLAPHVIGELLAQERIVSGAYANGRAYAVGSGLAIVDVHNPHDPEIIGRIDEAVFGSTLTDIVVAGDRAWIAEGDDLEHRGISIVDVSDASSPVVIARAGAMEVPGGLAIDDGRLYLASGLYLESFTLSCGASGDLDADGWIDSEDMLLLLGVIYRGLLPPGDPDPDGSGVTDGGDLSTVLNTM
jgi:hypothetical protein